MCACDGRSNDRLNEWTVQTTEKLTDMIQPYDSQTNKNVFFILIETALHDFKFNELLLRVYCVYTFCLPTLARSIWPLKQH